MASGYGPHWAERVSAAPDGQSSLVLEAVGSGVSLGSGDSLDESWVSVAVGLGELDRVRVDVTGVGVRVRVALADAVRGLGVVDTVGVGVPASSVGLSAGSVGRGDEAAGSVAGRKDSADPTGASTVDRSTRAFSAAALPPATSTATTVSAITPPFRFMPPPPPATTVRRHRPDGSQRTSKERRRSTGGSSGGPWRVLGRPTRASQ
jgi:hypothetical protein